MRIWSRFKSRDFFSSQFCNHSLCNASTYLGTSMLEEPLLWNSILTGSCEKIMSIDVLFSIEIHWCPISIENKYDYRAQKSQLHKCWVKCLGIEVIVTHQYLCGERNQLLSGLFLYMQQCPHVLSQWMEDKLWKRLCHFLSFICKSLNKSTTICVKWVQTLHWLLTPNPNN